MLWYQLDLSTKSKEMKFANLTCSGNHFTYKGIFFSTFFNNI